MDKCLIKQNINFLEYPLWFQDDRLADNISSTEWRDRDGYIYTSGYKIPVKTDGIFLLYLLLQSQKNNYTQKVALTRYQMLKECGKTISKGWYSRLEDSLNRWLRVDITFKGKFYDGIEYSNMAFHIIDSWEIEKKSNKLVVVFSPKFIELMEGKGFFKYINFTEFKRLDSPLATRLYEILSKTFHGRVLWEIDAMKLAQKIPLALRYPSEVVPKIKTAINRINKNTELKIDLSVRKKERGKAVLVFRKIISENKKTANKPIEQPTFESLQTDEFATVLEALPKAKQKQKSIIQIIKIAYEQSGPDYVIRNIKYANKYAQKNYRSFLVKCLKEDWGISIIEDEMERLLKLKEDAEQRQELIREERKLVTETNKAQKEQDMARKYINELSAEARVELEKEALQEISKTNPTIFKNLKSESPAVKIATRIAIKATMEKLALQRLNFR